MNSDRESVELTLNETPHNALLELDNTRTDVSNGQLLVHPSTSSNNHEYSQSSASSIEILGVENEDFYHSQCCLILLCNTKNRANCLSDTFHSRKSVVIIVCLLFIYGLCVVIQQSTKGHWPQYCSFNVYFSLEILRSCILKLIMILLMLSFNVKIFKKQCVEFETMYKLYNCLVIIFCVELWEATGKTITLTGFGRCTPFLTVQELMYPLTITFGVLLVTCIDAWRVPVYTKLFALFLVLGGIIYYYYYFAGNYGNERFTDWYIYFGSFDIGMYYLSRNAIETLILLAAKQFCLCVYNEIKFDKIAPCFANLNINCCGKNKDCALSITTHSIIVWKIQSSKNDPLLSIQNDSNDNINNSDNTSINNIKEAYKNEDFYHSDSCTTAVNRVCIGCTNDQTRMSTFFQSSKVWIPFAITLFVCGVLSVINLIIDTRNLRNIGWLAELLSIFELLLVIILVSLVLLSFNVKLLKLQLRQFETIYKLYNCVKIIMCQISYDINQISCNGSNCQTDAEFYLSTIGHFMRSLALLLLVVFTSCIDSWPINVENGSYNYSCVKINIKLVALVFSFIVITYWYYINAAYTEPEDYFTVTIEIFDRLSNGYETANFAYETILAFLFKQICLLIYYQIDLSSICCKGCNCNKYCCKCEKIKFGQQQNKAVAIIEHPKVVWEY